MTDALSPEPVTVWVELTEDEVVNAFKKQCGVPGLLKKGVKTAIIPIILVLAFCLWRGDDIALGDPQMLFLLGLLILLALGAFGLGVFRHIGFIEYRYLAHRFYQDPLIYAIGQQGITVSSYQGDNRLPWRSIKTALESPDMLILVTYRDAVLPIPKRCFSDNYEMGTAISHLRAFSPVYALLPGDKSPMRVSPNQRE